MELAQISDLSSKSSYESALEMEKNGGFGKNTGFLFCNSNYQPDISQSVINFKNQIDQNLIQLSTESSLLSFDQTHRVGQDEYFNWEGEGESFNNGCQWSQMINSPNFRLFEDLNCFQKASNFAAMDNPSKEKINGSDGSGNYWLYSEESDVIVEEESRTVLELSPQKRPYLGDNEQTMKKQCNNSTKKTSPKTSPAKDPQSIAAKNRRERISEKLKLLQELVPNGSKVDLVTMLEKAISYVKFLQLQAKILATDEFWPVQGGKAPDISQVREAIDAILSSQKDRSSSSNSAMLNNGG